MMPFEEKSGTKWSRFLAVAGCAMLLAACAGGDNDERDSLGSRLAQPPHGTKRPAPIEAGDIAIVGQEVAHAITSLPAVASANPPPLVRFNGVTSIINPPIDTTPYTELLRDRLLLLTRAKLRFVEHTLPPYVPGGKHKHAAEASSQNQTDAQYQVLAEMRGQATSDTYKVQVEFVDLRSGDLLYNETYRIRKESEGADTPEPYNAPPPPSRPAAESGTGKPAGYYDPTPAPSNDYEPPPTHAPKNEGNNGIL